VPMRGIAFPLEQGNEKHAEMCGVEQAIDRQNVHRFRVLVGTVRSRQARLAGSERTGLACLPSLPGFIGSNLADSLLADGEHVVGYAISAPACRSSPPRGSTRISPSSKAICSIRKRCRIRLSQKIGHGPSQFCNFQRINLRWSNNSPGQPNNLLGAFLRADVSACFWNRQPTT
jgi:hypothetical protein